MRKFLIAACALPALLSACGAPPRPSTMPPATRPVPPQPRPEVQVMHLPGLEGVIGMNAGVLLRAFGQPRIDLTEGDVRKLQFSGAACVLDIYLYPPRNGGEPVATHVDARRSSDGRDVDRAACVEAMRRR